MKSEMFVGFFHVLAFLWLWELSRLDAMSFVQQARGIDLNEHWVNVGNVCWLNFTCTNAQLVSCHVCVLFLIYVYLLITIGPHYDFLYAITVLANQKQCDVY